MGLSRRFLNLIVENRITRATSLRCLDLTRHKLFNTTTPNGSILKNKRATAATFKMEKISLPSPSFNVRASDSDQRMHFIRAADGGVFCLDQSGRGLLWEADTLVVVPRLHKPKTEPITLYIPSTDHHPNGTGGGGSLFVMERIVKPEMEAACHFEALVYRHPNPFYSYSPMSWECQLLPPPPPYIQVDENSSRQQHSCLEISSYAVLKNGSQICISVDGVGTYCLDTASYEWSEVGKWMLPFQGRVEYVPELQLWIGFSAEDRRLAAADLSTMDSQPPQLLLDSWKELDDDLPQAQGWQQIHDPQLVTLGSGRFCIARSFLHRTGTTASRGCSGDLHNNVTVLTGVEVAISCDLNSKVHLGMVKHKSRWHKSSCGYDTIMAVL